MSPRPEDRVTQVPDGHGGFITVIQPSAHLIGSNNWRFTREAYLRYEPQLIEAVKNWPAETAFEVPPGLSVNTYVRCLREARTSLLTYNYNPDLAARLRPISDETVISMDPSGTKVWFRLRQPRGRGPKANPTIVNEIKRPLFHAGQVQPLATEDELRALVTLARSGRISSPFHFQGQFPAELITKFETEFDSAFAYDELTNTTTLVI